MYLFVLADLVRIPLSLVDYPPNSVADADRGVTSRVTLRCTALKLLHSITMDGIERKKQESKLRREASRKSALEPTSSPAADGADDAPAKRIRKSRKGSGPESRTFGGLSGVLEDINVAALPAQLWAASGPSAALLVLVVQNLLLRYAEAEA